MVVIVLGVGLGDEVEDERPVAPNAWKDPETVELLRRGAAMLVLVFGTRPSDEVDMPVPDKGDTIEAPFHMESSALDAGALAAKAGPVGVMCP